MERNQRLPCSAEVLDSLWIANSPPSFLGSASTMMINYDENSSDKSLFPQADKEESGNDEDLFDANSHQPEKKRRLLPGQVQFLERSFDVENKLEPERKVQLAKEVGLQPRQVAIWFQNRRARYKNKQLEKDYDMLKSNYDLMKSDHDNLFKENEKLKNEVQLLNEKMRLGEKGYGEPKKVKSNDVLENVSSRIVSKLLGSKQEDASSARSDVLDSNSPHYTDDSSNNIFHEDEIDDSCFLKVEDDCYGDLQPNPCILGLNVEDHGTWFWN